MPKEGSIAWYRQYIKNITFNTRRDELDFFGLFRAWSDESGAGNIPKREADRAAKIALMFWKKMKELGWDV